MRQEPVRRLPAVLALLLAAGLLAGIGIAGGAPPAAKTKRKTTVTAKPVTPAPPPAPTPPPPGAAELAELSFLAGNWRGSIDNAGLQMDITIKGTIDSTGHPMRFRIHVTPGSGINIGIQGDYTAVLSWSTRYRALRALVTDPEGRGVELTGAKTPGSAEWLFNSTSEGSPFPFKVRLRRIAPDQLVLDYLSGGRIALNYTITFNRVAS
jgi:hypothetical protein